MANENNVYKMIKDFADTVVDKFATKTSVTEGLATKQAAGDYVTNEALGETLQGYAEINPLSPFITEAGAELLYQPIGNYAPAAGTGEGEAYATEGYVDGKITDLDLANTYQAKGDYAPATGSTEYATKTELGGKADSSDVYTKTEVDTALAGKQAAGDYAPATGSTEYATKTEVNDIIGTLPAGFTNIVEYINSLINDNNP